MDATHHVLVGLCLVIVLGIGAQWLAWWLKFPSILLLLLAGMAAGPLTGLIDTEALLGDALFPLVSIAVALVLFEGGLKLRFAELAGIGAALRNLLTVGVLLTWALIALVAWMVLELSVAAALLLGSVLVVTGPTVIGPLLLHIRPTGRAAAIAKWEGIVIDPIGATLAVLTFETIGPLQGNDYTHVLWTAGVGVVRTLAAGGVLGFVGAALSAWLFRRFWVPEFLQGAFLFMGVVAVFTAANSMQDEAGLLAVTVMGIALANWPGVRIDHVVEFKENLRVLLIACLFVLLAARLDPARFVELGWRGPLFVALLIVLVRPVVVAACTWRTGLPWRERVFLAWMAPRGIVAAAVASVFALRLGPDAGPLAPATFQVILGTVAIYGLTAGMLARKLGLSTAHPQGLLLLGADEIGRAIGVAVQKQGFRVVMLDKNFANVQAARMAGLTTCFASVLSEHVLEEDLDLSGVGRLLAMTPNDEVNLLAATQFSGVFDRADIYQLAPRRYGEGRTQISPQQLQGRLLFNQPVTHAELVSRFLSGAVVKSTPLTAEFDFEALLKRQSGEFLPLFVISESKSLRICSADKPIAPKPGQTVIYLARPSDSSADEAADEVRQPSEPS